MYLEMRMVTVRIAPVVLMTITDWRSRLTNHYGTTSLNNSLLTLPPLYLPILSRRSDTS